MNFIILGAGRCGASMLRLALDSHPEISCEGEALKKGILQKVNRTYQQQHRYVFNRDTKAKGCKLFFHQLSLNNKKWDWFKDNATIFHLLRNDLIRWYVSMRIARQTGKWNVDSKKKIPKLKNRQITIIPNSMKTHIQEYIKNIEWARSFFADARYYETSYEQLTKQWDDITKSIQEILNVTVRPIQPTSVKINKEPIKKLVTNYNDIKNEVYKIHCRKEVSVGEVVQHV